MNREIYGYCPVINTGGKTIDRCQAFIQGAETATKNVFNCIVVFREIQSSNTPNVEGATSEKYEKFTSFTRYSKITLVDGTWDIKDHTPLEGTSVSLKGSTIQNILMNDAEESNIKEQLDKLVKDLELPEFPKDYNMLDSSEIASNLTDGSIVNDANNVQVPGTTRLMQEWKGTKPFDVLINAINKNLSILSNNYSLKGDVFTQTYTALYDKAMAYAIDLEKNRQNVYLGLLNYKVQVLKALSDYNNASSTKATIKVQTKLYHTQMFGFKANNINKLFSSQLEGATTGFSSGMLDFTPVTNSNSELMSGYTNVKNYMEMV